jgi:toxin FitB
MPAALLDTNAVSDLMRDDPKIKARAANHPDPIATSVVVIDEIRYGLQRLPAGKKRTNLEGRAQTIVNA